MSLLLRVQDSPRNGPAWCCDDPGSCSDHKQAAETVQQPLVRVVHVAGLWRCSGSAVPLPQRLQQQAQHSSCTVQAHMHERQCFAGASAAT